MHKIEIYTIILKKCRAYEIAQELKQEGKIKHIGISFHDTADVLEMILKEQPEIEVVQIQFNYLDITNPVIESEKVYNMCRKYNKPILIMEPVKGGVLANLPNDAKAILDNLGTGASAASYALRYAASFEGVYKVLSGMSNLEQVKDNISFMKDFKPFTKEEYEAVNKVREILINLGGVQCTACRYCIEKCPKHILIPDLFRCYNAKKQFDATEGKHYYEILTKTNGKASDCIACKQCERICPQHLKITEHLKDVAKIFE